MEKKTSECKGVDVYYAPWEKSADRILTPFEHFVHRESSSSIFLISATFIALFMANSVFSSLYYDLTHLPMGFTFASYNLEKTLHHWVNDGLMALFFFVVGLELKREILVGELANLRKAALPVIAAIGGMVVPALIYFLLNREGDGVNGWAIPMATDIAFAIGVMVFLGNRIPRSLMAFLVALAIADDLGAVAVIALFYTESLSYPALFAALSFTIILALLNFSGVRWAIPYFIVAVLLWFAMLFSGIHATLAGIIGAFAVPARQKFDPEYFGKQMRQTLIEFDSSHTTDDKIITNISMKSLALKMEELLYDIMTPLQRLQHIWHIPVAFIVIPLFALFNAGVPLSLKTFSENGENHVLLGIICGLVFGKFIGIAGFCWIAIKLKIAQLPNNTSFAQIAGAALLAGIGFTMSIFIAQLAFEGQEDLLKTAKTGILIASLISGIAGYAWLWVAGREKRYGSNSIPLEK